MTSPKSTRPSSTRWSAAVQQPASDDTGTALAIHVLQAAEPRVAPTGADACDAASAPSLEQRELSAAEATHPVASRQPRGPERMDEALLVFMAEGLKNPDVSSMVCTSKALHDALAGELAERKLHQGLEKIAQTTRGWLRELSTAATRKGWNAQSLQNWARALFDAGLYDEALLAARAVIAVEAPSDSRGHERLAEIHLQQGHYDLALDAAKTAVARNARSDTCSLSRAHLLMGDIEPARKAMEAPVGSCLPRSVPEGYRVLVMHACGQQAEARLELDRLTQQPQEIAITPLPIAEACAFLGEADRALAFMQKAADRTHPGVIHVALSPFTAGLDDRRWLALRAKAKEAVDAARQELQPVPALPTHPHDIDLNAFPFQLLS